MTNHPLISHHGLNPNKGHDFIVSDLHGCFDLLIKALNSLGFNWLKDRLFLLGDLIDRGPSSMACLTLLTRDRVFCVKGNHEEMFSNIMVSAERKAHFIENGGEWVNQVDVSAFGTFEKWHQYWSEKIDNLPLAATVTLPTGDVIGMVHGEILSPDFHAIDLHDEGLLWGRLRHRRQFKSPVGGVTHLFCGHTIVTAPQTLGNTTYLDLGAFKTGRLAIACLSQFDAANPRDCIKVFYEDAS